MTRLTRGLISVAALLATSPAFAGGQHGADVARPVIYAAPNQHPDHDTRELENRVNHLTHDVNRDTRALIQDQQRLNALEVQAAQANVGKAPPLSPWQQNELVDLRRVITHLNQDIAHDNQRRAVDEVKIEAWQ
ncbi:MAG: hypothetical protein WA864_29970 [Acetobacteraceae bacterium]|jgi:hypothetical protein